MRAQGQFPDMRFPRHRHRQLSSSTDNSLMYGPPHEMEWEYRGWKAPFLNSFHPLLHPIMPSNHLPLYTWLKNASEERIFAFAALPKGCAAANDRAFWPCKNIRLFYLRNTLPQYTTSIDFLSSFLPKDSMVGGFWVILLGFQERKHQPFPMAQPFYWILFKKRTR